MRSLQGRNTMASQPMRDQVEDHLITPKNAALLISDYQPLQVSSIVSMDHRTLVAIIVAVARLGKLYALPIVLSTSTIMLKQKIVRANMFITVTHIQELEEH